MILTIAKIDNRKFMNLLVLICQRIFYIQTRMHSSRMRTGRSLTVCLSLLWGLPSSWGWGGGGVSLAGGGESPWQGVPPSWGGSPWQGGLFLGGGGSPWQGGLFLAPWGGLFLGGSPYWGSATFWGASFWGEGFSLGGAPYSGGASFLGGLPLGGSPSGGVSLADTPPVNRITHSCKNITLATTSLRPVIM